jgi:hypothetical protein
MFCESWRFLVGLVGAGTISRPKEVPGMLPLHSLIALYLALGHFSFICVYPLQNPGFTLSNIFLCAILFYKP